MPAETAAQFNIHDVKTNVSRIIGRVEHGEEIIISRAGNPVADRPGPPGQGVAVQDSLCFQRASARSGVATRLGARSWQSS